MKSFILDCSVTMGWCFEDQSSAYTDAVLKSLEKTSAVVPSLWAYEVMNVLLVAERRKKISAADATHFMELLKKLSIKIVDDKCSQLDSGFLSLARDFALSSYDAVYLNMAMKNGMSLATRDEALLKACKKNGVKVYLK